MTQTKGAVILTSRFLGGTLFSTSTFRLAETSLQVWQANVPDWTIECSIAQEGIYMLNQYTTFISAFTCAVAVSLSTGCDPDPMQAGANQDFEQIERGRAMEAYAAKADVSPDAYFLGTWRLPAGEDCAQVYVFRDADYPVDTWIDWLNSDMNVIASRPTDLLDQVQDSFQVNLSQAGDDSGTFSLVANITLDPDSPLPDGEPVWATARPCR